ncbi:hypothetical protein J7T55_007744 [Diaporthe amygdali]|uniref:uncharacterized protein n=1 Tax=Phomopsis amygdali TaxID=1214568 RepID=UPI0022FEEED5|nr:uncharacterized protein J7T55_007744 [Diaporthe amygdali]KAJ0107554.1 hypothetical protein J7T55_007744 [Diaporthe amygdali]
MEAAGLVLGVIPVAIQGLNTYRDIVSSIKNARRDLDCLLRDLKTEHQILQNTCEILLKGIAPDSVLDVMIEEPFGADWDAYNNEVHLRLWRSSTVFKERVEEMREAALDLQRKLAIDGDGKTRFSDRGTILKEWKHNAHFSLNKKDYRDILARLKDGNAVLNTLATQNSELEPTRRSRSQAKLAHIIRKLSQEVYAAFRNVLTCSCPHNLGLGMAAVSRKDVILPGTDGQCAARTIPLDIMLESGGKTQRWNRLRVQLADEKARPPMPPTAKSTASLSRSRSPKKTQYSSYLSASIQLSSETLPSAITDLCHTLQKGKYKTSATSDCFGNISCNSRRFNLYHQDCQPDHLSAISLSTILEIQGNGGDLKFNYTERLKLALALSYSVLHLYKTPWLAKTVTPQDIVFLKEQQQASPNAASYLGRPFLAKTPPSSTSASQFQSTQAEGRPIDLTILSLGLLLIQIMIGRQISDLALTPDMHIKSTLSKKEIASKYIASVMESGGMNYAGVVQWCLGSILSVACLDDEKFAQDFYNAVIMRLEGDLGLQSLMTVSGSET